MLSTWAGVSFAAPSALLSTTVRIAVWIIIIVNPAVMPCPDTSPISTQSAPSVRMMS
jgi:hypothetical protein